MSDFASPVEPYSDVALKSLRHEFNVGTSQHGTAHDALGRWLATVAVLKTTARVCREDAEANAKRAESAEIALATARRELAEARARVGATARHAFEDGWGAAMACVGLEGVAVTRGEKFDAGKWRESHAASAISDAALRMRGIASRPSPEATKEERDNG